MGQQGGPWALPAPGSVATEPRQVTGPPGFSFWVSETDRKCLGPPEVPGMGVSPSTLQRSTMQTLRRGGKGPAQLRKVGNAGS